MEFGWLSPAEHQGRYYVKDKDVLEDLSAPSEPGCQKAGPSTGPEALVHT